MKKLLKLSTVLIGIFMSNLAKSQGLEEGNFIVDAFYGGPNLISNIISADVSGGGFSTSSKITGFGPFGIRLEYMLSKKAGLGLDIHHAASIYSRTVTTVDGNNKTQTLQDELNISRTRFIPRFNVHFGKDKLDVFWHIGIGFANWSADYRIVQNTDNYFSVTPIKLNRNSTIAVRTGIGLRYFFTDNIGINADFGLGGPLATAGLSLKF